LRALLYMDEVFGYFPPSENPPSKKPMLTLLKQARAYGLGVLLATQNPVDLDYKGLSNAGTWFLGRLQTERDKMRVIEGLEGAAATSGATFDRAEMEQILAGLGNRRFLMNNVHEDAPVLFETRWVLSYLAGPMTREQIRRVTEEHPADPPDTTARVIATAPSGMSTHVEDHEVARPTLPASVTESFLPVTRLPSAGERLVYRPCLLGAATVHYAKSGIDEWRRLTLMAPIPDGAASPWSDAELLSDPPELDDEPVVDARFAELPATAGREKSHARWTKQVATHLYREAPLTLMKSKDPEGLSAVDEDESAFRGRLRAMDRESRDREIDKLRRRYAPKLDRLRDRIARAEQQVEVQREQYESKRNQSVISIGATLVGALFGRKLGSVGNVGRAASSVRGVTRAAREKGDIARAAERVEAVEQQLRDLEAQFEDDLQAIETTGDRAIELQEVVIRLRKADTEIEPLRLLWVPWRVAADGASEPAHSL